MTLPEAIASQAPGVRVWLMWLMAVNAASLLFLRRVEARWVFAAWLANIASMIVLLRLYGGGHHMSLPHVVLWTPLLAWLGTRARRVASGPRAFAVWMVLLAGSITISLALDYLNVAKWVLG